MFTITASRPVTWPNFALVKGKNDFLARSEIPAELWPKLARFRDLGVLTFEGAAEAGKPEKLSVEGMTEQQIYQLGTEQLAALAQSVGFSKLGAKKKDIVDALVAKLPKPAPTATTEAAPSDPKAKPAAPGRAVTIE